MNRRCSGWRGWCTLIPPPSAALSGRPFYMKAPAIGGRCGFDRGVVITPVPFSVAITVVPPIMARTIRVRIRGVITMTARRGVIRRRRTRTASSWRVSMASVRRGRGIMLTVTRSMVRRRGRVTVVVAIIVAAHSLQVTMPSRVS